MSKALAQSLIEFEIVVSHKLSALVLLQSEKEPTGKLLYLKLLYAWLLITLRVNIHMYSCVVKPSSDAA